MDKKKSETEYLLKNKKMKSKLLKGIKTNIKDCIDEKDVKWKKY